MVTWVRTELVCKDNEACQQTAKDGNYPKWRATFHDSWRDDCVGSRRKAELYFEAYVSGLERRKVKLEWLDDYKVKYVEPAGEWVGVHTTLEVLPE